MVKKKKVLKKKQKKQSPKFQKKSFFLGLFLGILILTVAGFFLFEKKYQGRVYPGVKILGFDFGGKKTKQVKDFFETKNYPFENLKIIFFHQDKVATVSGESIRLGFDSDLSAQQAHFIGRSGDFFSQSSMKFKALTQGIELSPLFKWKKEPLEKTLDLLSQTINIEPQNALFNFEDSKVVAFRLSKKGQRLNTKKTLADLEIKLATLTKQASFSSELKIPLRIEIVEPEITNTKASNLGITTLLVKGFSYFQGSSKERIHNIALSSSLLHGLLIAPKEVFSLNNALGDISAATGYQSSYIIKEGKTVLGDGGGVCQVSSTLFRAALNAGLEIIERHPHSYRVYYYEQGGFSPGMDATIFSPSIDLKIKNNTPAHILIQTILDYNNSSLTFEFYGQKDDREVNISKVKTWDQQPPPEDKYIDDPTLPKDQIKQIDWKAWGIKTSFSYKVTKDNQVLTQNSFYSNFQPWQAVFLRGTRE